MPRPCALGIRGIRPGWSIRCRSGYRRSRGWYRGCCFISSLSGPIEVPSPMTSSVTPCLISLMERPSSISDSVAQLSMLMKPGSDGQSVEVDGVWRRFGRAGRRWQLMRSPLMRMSAVTGGAPAAVVDGAVSEEGCACGHGFSPISNSVILPLPQPLPIAMERGDLLSADDTWNRARAVKYACTS